MSKSGSALTLSQHGWLFATAIAALIPLLPWLPEWLIATALGVLAWHAWLIRRGAHLPSRWILAVFALAACAGVQWQYHRLFGRDPGLALLAIFLSLKLLEMRNQRDGMIVVLLSFFLLLAGFFFDQRIPAAFASVVALVVIVGSLIALQSGPARPVRKILRISASLLAQALPFMLALFLLFPRVQGPLWGMPQDATTQSTGLSDTITPGSISRLAQSDAIAFRVQFKGDVPPPEEQYWRTLTLSNYDGTRWSYRPLPERAMLPYPTDGFGNDVGIDYAVTLEANNQRWLPALDTPIQMPPDAKANADGVILASQPVRTRLRYDMRSHLALQTGTKESPQRLAAALRLPANGNPRTRALAAEWKQRYTSDADILQAAEAFFLKQQLSYTLNPPPMNENAVDTFLFDEKRGFCEHFASALAFALRAAGVPARLVGGYQGGELNPVDGYFIVHQYDAHVWIEAWITGRGWVRVDPTADSVPGRIAGGLDSAVGDNEAPLFARRDHAWLRDLRYRLDAATNMWNQAVLGFGPQRQRDVLAGLGMHDPDWQTMVIWLASLCGVMIAILLAFVMRPRGQTDAAQRLWHDAQRRLQELGVDAPVWMGPQAYAEHAAAKLPQHAAAIHAIASAYIALRYAKDNTPQHIAMLRDLMTRLP